MSVVDRELDLSERDLFSSVGNALSSLFTPIFPGQQTTSETSTSSTLTLTQSATATQTDTLTQSTATSTATSTTSTVASTRSSSSSSSRATSSSSSSSATATSSAGTSSTSATQTSAETVVSTGPQGTVTLTETSSSSASATAAANAATSKGFLANKGLSVGVITACSLVGLVLIIIVATWTLRRRRRNKLHEEAVDFTPFPSSDELLSKDVERSGGGGGRTRPSSRGSANSNDGSLPPASARGAVQPKTSAPEMYQTGYPVAPVFVPTAGLAAPSKAVTSNIINQVAFPSQAYSNPMQGYNDFGPYPVYDARSPPPANANAYQPAGTLAPRPGPTYNNGYGATAGAASAAAAPAGPPVRKASQRKQVPPLNLSATRDDASPPAYQITPVTGNNASPMLANPYGTTPNLADPPLSAVSPHPKRGSKSLLNSPVHLAYSDEGASVDGDKASEKPRSRTNSYSRMLDPGLPQMPVAAPLPDEFGTQGDAAVKDEKAAVRQLTVRNE